jgi:hypothetical protein
METKNLMTISYLPDGISFIEHLLSDAFYKVILILNTAQCSSVQGVCDENCNCKKGTGAALKLMATITFIGSNILHVTAIG